MVSRKRVNTLAMFTMEQSNHSLLAPYAIGEELDQASHIWS